MHEVFIFSTSSLTLVAVCLFGEGEKWYPTGALVYRSLMTNDIEHIPMSLMAIHVMCGLL